MKKQSGYILFTAVFFLLCLIPSTGMFLTQTGESGSNEVLARLPVLRDEEGVWNTSYLTQLADYAEDNYYLRQPLVTSWSALNQRLLHTSIADNVLLGRDGWLYFGDTLDDYTGAAPLSEAEIASAARNLALVSEYCESEGAAFLFTIAPNKNSLYPQHMPNLPIFSSVKNADALKTALAAENVPYLDLFAAFAAHPEELYFTQDSHWNSKGAALAADLVNASLGRASGYFSGPFHPETDHRGDLYAMLYPTGTALEPDQHYDGALSFDYDAPIRSENDLNIRTSGGESGSLLMFRDSFGGLLYPYLADSFASAQFSRATAYKLNLISQREADCVVVELVERNLNYLLENVPVMPAPLHPAPEAESTFPDAISLTLEPSQDLPDYTLAAGTLPLTPDAGAPVLLSDGESSYEAFQLADSGFGLYLPEAALSGGPLHLLCTSNGKTVSIPAR